MKSYLFTLILSVFFSSSLFAEAPQITSHLSLQELNKLKADNPSDNDLFGYSVAIRGDTAVVGAYGYNSFTGTAYVYEYDEASKVFLQTAQLSAFEAADGDYFGWSVAIDGDTIVVGAYRDNDGGGDSGSAYVFEKSLSGWATSTETAKITASDAVSNDYFGRSVAISGDIIVVGASYDDDGGSNSGSVYIFEKPLASWVTSTQTAKITASDPGAQDFFGESIAISGDTIVIGAYGDDDGGSNSGSAYIFENILFNWALVFQTAKITAPDAAGGDYFGRSVAIDGDTIVIGANRDDDGGGDSGSAYIFEKSSSDWSTSPQTGKITASDAAAGDHFGISVAISGDTIVIGSYLDDDVGTDSGSVYIFEKQLSGWSTSTENAKITAPDAAAGDSFGWSVAIDGDTIVVGAYYDDDGGTDTGSAYIFTPALTVNSIENKKEIIDIEASDADPGDIISFSIIGGIDASFFNIDSVSGLLSFKAAPDFENPLDSNGDNIYKALLEVSDDFGESDTYNAIINVSNVEYEGKAPKAITFEKLNKIIASDGLEDDYFGVSVAISGTTAVVGASGYQSSTGTAYIYEYDMGSDSFIQKARIRASDNGVGDEFGISVAISGDTIIVGADNADSTSGSVYLFEKPELGWINTTENAILTASDANTSDYFGISVAISGDTVVVGADYDDTSGSVYLFEKPELGWVSATQSAKFTASDAAAGDRFGVSVSISSDTVIVGAFLDDDSDNSTGSAYLFEKPYGGWINATQSAKFTASDSEASDNFGFSVAISGDTVIVGAHKDEDGIYTNSGSAYLFDKPSTGWVDANESAKFTASDREDSDSFGFSVSISGDTVLVSAYRDDGVNSNSGSAYLFDKPSTGWINANESAKLTASDSERNDYFGFSVAISGDTVIGGSYKDDCTNGDLDCGSATIFKTKEVGVSPAIIMYLLN